MKKLYLLFCLLPIMAQAQTATYYNTAYGNTGESLRAALYNIIKGHTSVNYAGSSLPNTWTSFETTDRKANGKVWDVYSDIPGGIPAYEYDFTTEKCGNGLNHENSCYNHEHAWPQSKFGSALPMRSDLWIVYPTDYYVNGKRGDLPYGEVGTATSTFTNGSKTGNNIYSNAPSGNCFEPIDSFKGDMARSYFYITTRYLGDSASFQDWEMAIKSTLKPWAIQMLLEWHHLDPVSTKEKDRNNAIDAIQHNRNPFVDIPQFADCIWAGNCTGLSVPGIAAIATRIHVYPNPATDKIAINWQELAPDEVLAVDVLNVQGQILYHAPGTAVSQIVIPVSEWARGLYLLQVKTKHGVQAQKLLLGNQ